MGSLGVAVGSGRSGVSTRARSPVTLLLTTVHLYLSFGERAPYSIGGGLRLPPPHPCVSSHLGPRITGAITPVMSYFSAFVTGEGGGLLHSAAALGREVFRGGSGCTGGRSNRALQFLDAALEIPNFTGRTIIPRPFGSSSGATALTTSRLDFGGRPCLQCWKNCIRSTASSTVLG